MDHLCSPGFSRDTPGKLLHAASEGRVRLLQQYPLLARAATACSQGEPKTLDARYSAEPPVIPNALLQRTAQ